VPDDDPNVRFGSQTDKKPQQGLGLLIIGETQQYTHAKRHPAHPEPVSTATEAAANRINGTPIVLGTISSQD
jgi:hypothetical protein